MDTSEIRRLIGCQKETALFFPWFSWSLSIIIGVIALLTFDFWSLEDKASLNLNIATTFGLSVSRGYARAIPGLFTYHLFLFSAIHLVYSLLLIQYYLFRTECLLGTRKTVLIYWMNAIIPPILTFGIVMLGAGTFGWEWALQSKQTYSFNWYVGPSIAIWGCAGFIMTRERHNPIYWTGFFLLIGLAIILKLFGLRATSEWSSDIAHLLAFFLSAIAGTFYFRNKKIERMRTKIYSVNYIMATCMGILLAFFAVKTAI